MVANYTTYINTNNKLVLKDTSNYQGTTITNRYWILTDSEGNKTFLIHPIVLGTNDELIVNDIVKDMSLFIELVYNYNTTTGISAYSKSKNVLYSPFISSIIENLRKDWVDTLLDKDKEPLYDKLLKDIEMIVAFSDSSISLLSSDLKGSQLALDMGNNYANDYKDIV